MRGARLSPRLWEARFEIFEAAGDYTAIVVLVGSFQLITSCEQALGTLRRFRELLMPGGRLILDLGAPGEFFQPVTRARHWTDASGDLVTLHENPAGRDDLSQTSTWHLR